MRTPAVEESTPYLSGDTIPVALPWTVLASSGSRRMDSLSGLRDLAAIFPADERRPRGVAHRNGWLWTILSPCLHLLIVAVFFYLGANVPESPHYDVIGELTLFGAPGPGSSGGQGQEKATAGGDGTVHPLTQSFSGQKASPAQPVQQAKNESTVLNSLPKAHPKPQQPQAKKQTPEDAARKTASPSATDRDSPAPVASAADHTAQGDGSPGQNGGVQGNGYNGHGAGLGGNGSGDVAFGQGEGPKFYHRSLPRYPSEAKRLNKEGRVRLRLAIDSSGSLRNVDVMEHTGLEFVEEALRAIRASSFVPAMSHGQPVASQATLTIHFKLN